MMFFWISIALTTLISFVCGGSFVLWVLVQHGSRFLAPGKVSTSGRGYLIASRGLNWSLYRCLLALIPAENCLILCVPSQYEHLIPGGSGVFDGTFFSITRFDLDGQTGNYAPDV